ncbi:hypothetical protein Btru_048658 [Bulinus truncatus]|nr:hypothetical protein Btru_048658 [Bulinus truncatus]
MGPPMANQRADVPEITKHKCSIRMEFNFSVPPTLPQNSDEKLEALFRANKSLKTELDSLKSQVDFLSSENQKLREMINALVLEKEALSQENVQQRKVYEEHLLDKDIVNSSVMFHVLSEEKKAVVKIIEQTKSAIKNEFDQRIATLGVPHDA